MGRGDAEVQRAGPLPGGLQLAKGLPGPGGGFHASEGTPLAVASAALHSASCRIPARSHVWRAEQRHGRLESDGDPQCGKAGGVTCPVGAAGPACSAFFLGLPPAGNTAVRRAPILPGRRASPWGWASLDQLQGPSEMVCESRAGVHFLR